MDVTYGADYSAGELSPAELDRFTTYDLRFLLRYVLLGAAAYGILSSFPASLRGLLAGLFLPVGAIACEAIYELYAAVRRDV